MSEVAEGEGLAGDALITILVDVPPGLSIRADGEHRLGAFQLAAGRAKGVDLGRPGVGVGRPRTDAVTGLVLAAHPLTLLTSPARVSVKGSKV